MKNTLRELGSQIYIYINYLQVHVFIYIYIYAGLDNIYRQKKKEGRDIPHIFFKHTL